MQQTANLSSGAVATFLIEFHNSEHLYRDDIEWDKMRWMFNAQQSGREDRVEKMK